ncbi:MAG: hypothetical protein AB7T49_17850 [Oligoflexales bacterium]
MKQLMKMILATFIAISGTAFADSELKPNQQLCNKLDRKLEQNGLEVDMRAVTVSENGKHAYALGSEVLIENGNKEINLMIWHFKKDGSSVRMVGADELDGFEDTSDAEIEVIALGQASNGTIAAQYSLNAEISLSELLILDAKTGETIETTSIDTKLPIAVEKDFTCD